MTDRVLLLELRERVSAAGNRYLSGWLGKASVVAFLDREADEPTWQVFVSTPSQRGNGSQTSHPSSQSPLMPRQRQPRGRSKPVPTGSFDDDLSDLTGSNAKGIS